jgi:hypothetical protein
MNFLKGLGKDTKPKGFNRNIAEVPPVVQVSTPVNLALALAQCDFCRSLSYTWSSMVSCLSVLGRSR